MPWLFLLAYTCSGLAGLIYEVSWTRLLTLYVGHSTAAASAVVGAFLGGLAIGAAAGGRGAVPLTRRQSLLAYITLELAVAVLAVILPFELRALTPVLQWAYADGQSTVLFPLVRLSACLLMVFVPAAALGATFPVATRWFATDAADPARASGWLYALNTAGAAIGALLAGFLLIPAVGLAASMMLGAGLSSLAAGLVAIVLHRSDPLASGRAPRLPVQVAKRRSGKPRAPEAPAEPPTSAPWLAAGVLGLTGFASLMHEIVWTRILALVLGPTIYAFAATVTIVIGGVAIGSALGAWLLGRVRRPEPWLGGTLAVAALVTTMASSLAGSEIPRVVATRWADLSTSFARQLVDGLVLAAALMLPTALTLGAAFPLALATAGADRRDVSSRFGLVYAVNTIGAVTGSLAAGFLLIPKFGLQATLMVVSVCLIGAIVAVTAAAVRVWRARVASVSMAAAALVVLAISPPWDRELLASGAYLYAPFVPKDLDLETLLKAGTLLYYREGASATVSVKRLTGTTTLAVDGKTDASNRGDMLTQKLVAHLPLLLHDNPRRVAIIGLGSGVTLGAALRHPIERAEVIEISPEVVEASRFFEAENGNALADARAHLVVGDGRSHMLLTRQQYDVIISEPSNPWIAGVAALFTREFFETARDRLAPDGVICQWANAYTISDADLRAIVATFRSVFPDGTAWLVGPDDVLLVGSRGAQPIGDRLSRLPLHWQRSGVAGDLAASAVVEPFSVFSLYAGGPGELARYADGAPTLVDDRMSLEFSAPREIRRRESGENSAALAALRDRDHGPASIREAMARPTSAQWTHRADMMARRDAHTVAYDDYLRAWRLDPSNEHALGGFVRTAVFLRRGDEALSAIQGEAGARQDQAPLLIARARLLAATGASNEAVAIAQRAVSAAPGLPAALEQLASLFADSANVAELERTIAALTGVAPASAPTRYYEAVLALLRDRPEDAVRLANETVAIDERYAPVYDLLGAAHTKLGHESEARAAFEASLRFDAHDSTAYTNLGLIELAAGNRDRAARYFAEALWLVPDSRTAREGLQRAGR